MRKCFASSRVSLLFSAVGNCRRASLCLGNWAALLAIAFLSAVLIGSPLPVRAQSASAAISYQGMLTDRLGPARGKFDLGFTLKDDPIAGKTVGQPILVRGLEITDGLFTANLNFGPDAFDGSGRWLELSVLPANSANAFAVLSPRQPITSAPYALRAVRAQTLQDGTIRDPIFLGTTFDYPLDLFADNQRVLRLVPNAVSPSLVGGFAGNLIEVSPGSIIAGGGAEFCINTIKAGSDYSAIGGGRCNSIGPASPVCVISGGQTNSIATFNVCSTIGGGCGNAIGSQSSYSTIGGGRRNYAGTDLSGGTIAGGEENQMLSSANNGTIGGGSGNFIDAFAARSTVSGGGGNQIGFTALNASIAGGGSNTVSSRGDFSAVGGGSANLIGASAKSATIPGGSGNRIADFASYSFAAGRRAAANHLGSLVWGDATDATVSSAASNSVTFRASGGVRFFSSTDTTAPAPGVTLAAGASSWSTISDRQAKKDFAPVDTSAILERLTQVPVQQWHYRWESDTSTPHMGPTAQDFKGAFYPGRDDRSITTLEFDGVALAAIQGLNRKLEEKAAKLEADNAALRESLADLKRMVESMAKPAGRE